MTFQNTLLRYREEKHGDSKMKFKTDKILGGLNIGGIRLGKADKAAPAKMGNIPMTGVYANSGELTIKPKSSFVVPSAIADKYEGVALMQAPRGKAPQLVISDADYIPDREYADAEV